jgi:hypothetical protein
MALVFSGLAALPLGGVQHVRRVRGRGALGHRREAARGERAGRPMRYWGGRRADE